MHVLIRWVALAVVVAAAAPQAAAQQLVDPNLSLRGASSVGLREGAKPGPSSAGTLDASFGTGGKVTTAFGLSYDQANAVALQADGKIIAAGRRQLSRYDDTDFALTRYHANGSLDSTFGAGGKVTTDIGDNTQDIARAVIVQTDGRIIAVGSAGIAGVSQFALTRYDVSGNLDTSFGKGGKVTTAFGTLDTSFGSGGKLTTGFGTNSDLAAALAIQSDGKIVAAGYAVLSGSGMDFALARYLP